MTNAQYTQGPWKAIEQEKDSYYIAQGEETICDLYYDSTPDDYVGFGREFTPYKNGEANARLIASAPELLEALTNALSSMEYAAGALQAPMQSTFRENIAAAQNAISRAKGA